MKLTRLELSGFKSFADTVALPFDDGMTAIVGPNGCGKSNISDAVRWVLGEQRARLLRGQKMEDVIFHGAAKHRPVNVAEVSLVFDNTDGTLPIEFREVVITRRLSRSGQSDYLINGAGVRLRDVQDLLRGTGLGSDAGVVIEAGMIERLLSDRPDDRRSLFEEAAGIGLYRDRKNTTERQLDRTTEDLQRLEDIISEVQREVRSLARQRGKAERHATFTAERFQIVAELARRELASFEDRTAVIAAAREDLAVRLPAARERLQQHDRGREAAAQARASAEAARSDLERRLGDARLTVQRLEGDLALAAEREQHAGDRRERALAERATATARADQATRDRDAAAAERQTAADARASVQTELDLRTTTETEARTRLAAAREQVAAIEDQLQEHAELLRTLTGERAALDAELADLDATWTEASRRRDAADQERQRTTTQRAHAERARDAAQTRDRRAEHALEQARHALGVARERESAARADRQAAEEERARLAARRDALERLEKDREGLAPAARRLLAVREQFAGAVLGPLSDFLRTSEADAPLAERLFGDWLHAVLVRDDAVDTIRAWHAREQPGPLVLLPAAGPAKAPDGDTPVPVTAEGPAAAWARTLLAGHALVAGDGTAIRRPNGAVVLSGGEAGGGPLQRRAGLEQLRRQLTDAERQVETLTATEQTAAAEHRTAEATLATAQATAEGARQALREAQGMADDAIRHAQRAEREHEEAAQAAARLAERREARRTRLQAVKHEERERALAKERLEIQRAERRAVLHELEAEQEAARERRVHWQVEEAQVSAREQAAAERAERAAQALEALRAVIATLDQELAHLDHQGGGLGDQRRQWTDALAEKKVAVAELETAAGSAGSRLAEADTRLTDAERAREALRHEVDQLNEQGHQLELERTELTGRRQALVERVEAEWHRPLDQLLADTEPMDGATAVLREEAERLARAIEAMGPVNPLAVEEHAEEQQRLEFLTTQRDDLVQARDRLREALKEIEVSARTMFEETFIAIRAHFHRVFQTLFEGGECDVRLADPSDPLGCDIDIHAAPRGKRIQRIHLLSSGERSLVAISLLFAIYLTKPSPFCLLDEVDAPLDDSNVTRFVRLLGEFKHDTQFIVITHNPRTMQVGDAVYGVTMQEPGVSTIVGVRLGEPATA